MSGSWILIYNKIWRDTKAIILTHQLRKEGQGAGGKCAKFLCNK